MLPARPSCGAKQQFSALGWERGLEQRYRKQDYEEFTAFPGLEQALILVKEAIGKYRNVYVSLAVSQQETVFLSTLN